MFGLFRAWRRKRWHRREFPLHWLPYLERLGFYQRLEPELKTRFRDLLKVFIWEKAFLGAAGLQVTEEMKVVIGAAAVRLILFLDLNYYNDLAEIVIYPFSAFHNPRRDPEVALLGETLPFGTVVLSWPAVAYDMAYECDGHDTALHEFAHVLDKGDGAFDGTPRLRAKEHYRPWAEVMSRHFLNLRRGDLPDRMVLDSYGSKNEAEFFAVATETFFEQPRQMKELTPDLYAELARFYGVNPVDSSPCA